MSDYSDNTVDFDDVLIIAETEMAVKIDLPTESGKNRQLWVPKSVIHDDSEIWKDGDQGTLTLKEWFCLKENLV